MAIVQQPVSYAVTSTSPTRIGGLVPPYTLINGDVNGTVWLADNAGARPGFGTPLHPGTSLVWNRPGDFFAISEPGFTNTIIISDVTDWEPDPAAIAAAVLNAGVLVVDDPVTLAQISVQGPGLTTPIDISRYQSLNVSILLDVDNPVNPLYNNLNILFGDGGVTTYRIPLNFAIEDQIWTAAIPCYGDSVRFELATDSNFDIFMSGSHRAIQTVRQRIDDYSDFGGLPQQMPTDFYFANILGGIPVGDTQVFVSPPWHGNIQASFRWSSPAAAAANFDLLVTNVNAPAFVFNAFYQANGVIIQGVPPAAHTYVIVINIPCNGASIGWNIRNGYAAAGSVFSGRITPTQGALVA